MKNILIISATIFPKVSPRSHRATELAKELARQGHHVVLYAVLGNFDYSDFENKYGVKVKNIGNMLFAKHNSDGVNPANIIIKILSKIFNRIFEFPDIEFMFKIPKIIQKETGIDALITIGSPHPIHWGAARARCKKNSFFPKVWIADCGDPYMGNKIVFRPFYFKYFERFFCDKVDYITVPIEGAKKAYYKKYRNKIRVIPQGYEITEDDIKRINNNSFKPLEKKNHIPTFLYAGTFYKKYRDPRCFLEFLSSYKKEFKFIIYTNYKSIIKPYVKKIGESIVIHDYIPRDELLKKMREVDFLINIENDSLVQSPSKLIDYALTARPILSIKSNKIDINIFNEFINGIYKNSFSIGDLSEFKIENISKNFIELIN